MADDDNFRHDLIIATEDGEVFHLKHDQWKNASYKVDPKEYQSDEGITDGTSWQLVRELLQCGTNVAVVPPVLPPYPDGKPRPQPRGTCYVLNLAGFKRSHRFHVKSK